MIGKWLRRLLTLVLLLAVAAALAAWVYGQRVLPQSRRPSVFRSARQESQSPPWLRP